MIAIASTSKSVATTKLSVPAGVMIPFLKSTESADNPTTSRASCERCPTYSARMPGRDADDKRDRDDKRGDHAAEHEHEKHRHQQDQGAGLLTREYDALTLEPLRQRV